MKKILISICVVILSGCIAHPPEKQNVVARVNDYEITKEEFEGAFAGSILTGSTDPQAKKEFLENLINQKLVLAEAQKEGLDKDPRFLKTVERFWEQSLLKVVLERKSREISKNISITDRDVRAVYESMRNNGETDKNLEEIYTQIKRRLTDQEESKAMETWIEDLRTHAQVTVNESLIQKTP